MRGWIVAELVARAVSSVGVQSDGDAQDDMTQAADAVSRAGQARVANASPATAMPNAH